jgi:hypothetical protein
MGFALDKTKVAQIGIKLASAPLRAGLNNVEKHFAGAYREEACYKLINDILPHNLIITQYNNKFRQTLLDRLARFSDIENSDYQTCSDEFIARMIGACGQIYTLLETRYPYVREVNSNLTDSWSPVDSGPVTVVSGWGTVAQTGGLGTVGRNPLAAASSAFSGDELRMGYQMHGKRRRRGWGFRKSRSKDSW